MLDAAQALTPQAQSGMAESLKLKEAEERHKRERLQEEEYRMLLHSEGRPPPR